MFILILISLLVPLSLSLIIAKTQSIKPSSPNMFKYPKFLVIFFGFFTIVLLSVNVWLCLTYKENLKAFIFLFPCYLLFATLVIWMFLTSLNYRLVLEEEYMLYRNLFGRVKIIKYEEISEIKTHKDKSNNVNEYKIYIVKKKIYVNCFMINFKDFSRLMKKKLKTIKSSIKF